MQVPGRSIYENSDRLRYQKTNRENNNVKCNICMYIVRSNFLLY